MHTATYGQRGRSSEQSSGALPHHFADAPMTLSLSRRGLAAAVFALAALTTAPAAFAQDKFIVMSSTTSTEQSGLFKHLLPLFKQATGIDVRVVALGTGQALDSAPPRRRRHRLRARPGGRGEIRRRRLRARSAGRSCTTTSCSSGRRPTRAGVKGARTSSPRSASSPPAGQPFISRGDKSGTHAAELRYWKAAGIDAPASAHRRLQGVRLRHGAGAEHRAPRATPTCSPTAAPGSRSRTAPTWRSSCKATTRLFNQYGVMVVNPAKHPHVKKDLAQAVRRLGRLAGRVRRRSRPTRSRASSSSSANAKS